MGRLWGLSVARCCVTWLPCRCPWCVSRGSLAGFCGRLFSRLWVLCCRSSAGGGACCGALPMLCRRVGWWSSISVLPAFSWRLMRAVFARIGRLPLMVGCLSRRSLSAFPRCPLLVACRVAGAGGAGLSRGGFRRDLCYRLSLEVGFCVSLVVRVVDAASRFLGAWFPVAAVASCGRYAGVVW